MDNNKLFTDQHEVVKYTMFGNLARQNTILLQLENGEEEVVKKKKPKPLKALSVAISPVKNNDCFLL